MPADRAVFCETPEEAAELVAELAGAGDVILIKGSRGVRMEALVDRLRTPEEE
jgi:UDP-N-acetylmuramyl pentapeptide synthase